jgi:hypothetical protein
MISYFLDNLYDLISYSICLMVEALRALVLFIMSLRTFCNIYINLDKNLDA